MRKTFIIIMCIIFLCTLTACLGENDNTVPPSDGEDNIEENIDSDDEQVSYSEELANLFPPNIGTKFRAFGLAEYAHIVEIKDIQEVDENLKYYIEGYFTDGMGEDPERRQFNINYIITSDSIIEVIDNNDEFRLEGYDDKIHSIIPNQTILKLPLEVGNYWEQEINYNNTIYTAKTIITSITLSDEGNLQYTTELVIKGIEDFFDDEYIEVRVYEEGKGLRTFSNSMKMYDFDVDREYTKEDFMFGYIQENDS